MKASEIRKKTLAEIKDLLLKTKREKLNLRFQKVNGQLESTAEVKKARRLTARLKTLLTEMQKSA